MAPNRKQISAVLDPLVDNTSLVQAKYLPLTQDVTATSSQAAAPAVSAEPTIIRNSAANDDYWNWSAPVEEEQVKPAAVDLFSTAHLEANLLKDAQRAESQVIHATSHTPSMSDNYWAERVSAHLLHNETSKASDNYWVWPAQKTESSDANISLVALVLEAEKARHLLSASHLEANLVQDSERRAKQSCLPRAEQFQQKSLEEQDEAYWTWTTPTTVKAPANEINESYWEWTTGAPSKESLIAGILEYEAKRQLFSASHIVANEVAASCATQAASTNVCASSDAYWSWPASDEEDYWNMRPKPAAAVVEAAHKGYWDW